MRHLGSSIAVALAVTLAGCGKPQAEAPVPAAPPLTEAQKQAVLAALPAPYSTGDLANGEAKFAMCRSCHTTQAGAPNMTGPGLHGVFGRKAGEVAGFNYSAPLKASGIVWDAARIDSWIADPHALVPGSKMSFAGMKDAKDRADVVAYLAVETHDNSK